MIDDPEGVVAMTCHNEQGRIRTDRNGDPLYSICTPGEEIARILNRQSGKVALSNDPDDLSPTGEVSRLLALYSPK